jgi:hypothetical protein
MNSAYIAQDGAISPGRSFIGKHRIGWNGDLWDTYIGNLAFQNINCFVPIKQSMDNTKAISVCMNGHVAGDIVADMVEVQLYLIACDDLEEAADDTIGEAIISTLGTAVKISPLSNGLFCFEFERAWNMGSTNPCEYHLAIGFEMAVEDIPRFNFSYSIGIVDVPPLP